MLVTRFPKVGLALGKLLAGLGDLVSEASINGNRWRCCNRSSQGGCGLLVSLLLLLAGGTGDFKINATGDKERTAIPADLKMTV